MINVLAVKAPGFGDRRKAMLEDIATLTGGRGDLRGGRPQARLRDLEDLGQARRVSPTRTTRRSSREGRPEGDPGSQSGRFEPRSRTPPRTTIGEAPGAPGQALRRRGGDQGRRGHRDGAQGEEAPHRGRPLGDPRRGSRRGSSPVAARPCSTPCRRSTRSRRSVTRRPGQHPAPRARGADAPDRHQRWLGGLGHRRGGPQDRSPATAGMPRRPSTPTCSWPASSTRPR